MKATQEQIDSVYPLIKRALITPEEAKSGETPSTKLLLSRMNPNKGLRPCLKCGTPFVSAHFGNRICGSCGITNDRAPLRATMRPYPVKKDEI